eukprot:scaffold109003_cov36-Cyclotella_meneghiniana.AAC.1
MDLPPQVPNESSPPQSQAHANNLPECNAIDFSAVDAVGTPAVAAMPALPPVDASDLDVDGAMQRLLETPGESTEPDRGDFTTDAVSIQDCMDTPVDRPNRIELLSPSKVEFPSKTPQDITRFTNFDESKFDEGYDSEGEQCFFSDELIVDDPDALNEETITPSTQPAPQAPAVPAALTEERIKTFNVAQLKDELKKRGRPVSGAKAVLAQRLIDAVNNNVPVAETAVVRDASMANLDVTAFWQPLTIDPTPVPEPMNIDAALRPPTERDAPITQKYDFKETFDRSPFLGTTSDMGYISNKRSPRKSSQKHTESSRLRRDPVERTKGGPSAAFLLKHQLDEHSHPMDWFTALMPLTQSTNIEDAGAANVTGDKVTKFSVANWAAYSNLKATIVNAGQRGHIFDGKYKAFSPSDIMKMMGVLIIDGLNPSPTLESKMQSQKVNRTHGNDFIAEHIGPGYQQFYRSFRHFFACQDPLKVPPPKQSCPNVKVDELFRWMRYIFKEAWVLGKECSVDEQTCKMQGRSEYKTRCGKFKRIGDGLQTDCIADDGFTYDFYFRNEPVDKKWTDMGMCPMHARLLHMFSGLRDRGHRVKMDNLFVSVNLAREAFCLPQEVRIHGVIRKSGRGVPSDVVIEPLTGKAEERARGTLKAAVLKGDSKSDNLVVACCYDQKPFYMLSHSCEKVGWTEIEKKNVYSAALRKNVPFKFLRFSLSHEYNYEMNDNDIADQLRLQYRMQRLQRNQKWWWSLWIWALEVTIVNAYKMMTRYCELRGINPKYSHHDFREKIAYALIDPEGEWPKRKAKTPPAANRKRNSDSQSAKPKAPKAPRFTNNTLSRHGTLSRRLDASLNHMPVVPSGDQSGHICQLHRWAGNYGNNDKKNNKMPSGSRFNVCHCKACGVNLCLCCFELYHTKANLEAEIGNILSNTNDRKKPGK